MKTFIASLFLIAILGQGLSAQDSILNSYERNFTRAGLPTKAGVLRDAATDSRAPEFIGQLYEFALVFALQNGELLSNDPDMISIVALAAQGVGTSGYKPSLDTLWKLFSVFHDTQTRTKILDALAILGKGNAGVIKNLNQFLADQNNLHRSGVENDYVTLLSGISALAGVGDKSSYPVLFSAMIADYPDEITAEAQKALDSIDGDYYQFLADIIRKNNPPKEKLVALRAGLRSARLGPNERGALAETVLDAGFEQKPDFFAGDAAVSVLRSEALKALEELKWDRATPLVVKYFYRIQTEYQGGNVPGEQLLEAITCLGVLGGAEAVQALALQLGYFNSQIERSGNFDEALTLEVVNALGKMEAKAAFDNLLYISYLPYPDSIQAAARDALSRLKW